MKKRLKIILIIILLIISLILYARYIGTYGFITKEHTLYHELLPSGFDGLKIVHFSDLHYKRAITKNKVNKIIDEINLLNPDIVIFTGDLIDQDTILTNDDFKYLSNTLSKIKAKYGKYAVIGNHDIKEENNLIDIYDNSNFLLLKNDYDLIYHKDGSAIYIGGIDNVTHNRDNIEETLEILKEKKIDYQIVITHEPDIADEILDIESPSLILAGHSHNGQIRLPIIGAIFTPPYSEKYYDEYYKINNTDLYISSGIGVSTINYRLNNKPSINFYRINKKAN